MSIEAAKGAISSDPTSWRNYSQLGLLYYKNRQYDEAIDAFEQALRLHPIRLVLEDEQRQRDAADAVRRANETEAERRYEQEQKAARSNLAQTVLGGLAQVPGLKATDAKFLSMLNNVNNVVSAIPDVQRPVERPDAPIPPSQLKASRESAEIYANLGMACAGAQRWGKSLAALEKALSLDATKVNLLYWVAEANNREGNYEKAVEAMRRYISLATEPPMKARVTLAVYYARLGLPDEARSTFSSVIGQYRSMAEAAPGEPEKWMGLAYALVQAGRHADASAALLKAVASADKLDKSRRYELAQSLWEVGDFENATAQLDKLLAEPGIGFPERNRALILLGRVQSENGQADAARGSYQTALNEWKSRNPDADPPSYLWTARIETGEAREAAAALEERYLDNPSAASVDLIRLALAYEKSDQLPAAIVALNEYLSRDPNFAPARRLLQRIGRTTEGLSKAALEKAERARATGDWAGAVRWLTEACRNTASAEERADVQRQLMAVVAKSPQPPAFPDKAMRLLMQGNAAMKSYSDAGDADRAIAAYQWALIYAPGSPELYLNLALADTLRQKYREASENLSLCLTGNPANEKADSLMKRLFELDYQRRQALRKTVQR